MAYISENLRQAIYERAHGRCEYCLYHEQFAMKPHEIDHIYAEKHGGETDEINLCLSCVDCNRYKGSNLCSLDIITGEIVPLFHPRKMKWDEHFRVIRGFIEPLTPQGRVTVQTLRLNDAERVAERLRLWKLKKYP
ncbi:MAG: HNH endonuclease [Anaerolineae bacterium]|nr:MAG: HNH endonuclease [Anaerolineae bacterium]